MDKLFRTTNQNVKSNISRAIKNNVEFCCQIADNKIVQGESFSYPPTAALAEWMNTLFAKELQPNPKKPGKQVTEILLVVISASETDVHVGISIPKDKTADPAYENLISEIIGSREHKSDQKDTYTLLQYTAPFPIKEQDELLSSIFSIIKKRKIYIEDKADEDEVYYGLD